MELAEATGGEETAAASPTVSVRAVPDPVAASLPPRATVSVGPGDRFVPDEVIVSGADAEAVVIAEGGTVLDRSRDGQHLRVRVPAGTAP